MPTAPIVNGEATARYWIASTLRVFQRIWWKRAPIASERVIFRLWIKRICTELAAIVPLLIVETRRLNSQQIVW